MKRETHVKRKVFNGKSYKDRTAAEEKEAAQQSA
jgi:hypothetical protein